uniref:Uncharacterized LOC108936243 n=1 Tax=Scleropages formosus TaxID=113540 RepID=A0A8C9RR25_SCLFO
MPDCCAAANCKCTDESSVAFFRFPLDPLRCKQWLDNCRRPDLEKKTPEQLHRLYKLCAKHFEPSLISRHSALRTVLKEGAVPTIFDFTSQLNKSQSCNRKRIRDPAEEECVTPKKPKDESLTSETKELSGESSTTCNLEQEGTERETVSTSKAKETLKLYFKEVLAFTAFSIRKDVNPKVVEPIGSHGEMSNINPICAEKIDQKEVLQLAEELMGNEMRNSLRSARFFSILLQDVAKIEGKDQIPVFIRSVTVAGFPQKHLLSFLPCDVDAEGLAYMLFSAIRNKWGLRMEHCRGLTYLTTGDICQKMKDLSSRILQEFPQVVLAPSDPYAFNMWLIRCMPFTYIQKVVDTLEEVADCLRKSPSLWKKVEEKIFSVYGHIKGEVDRIKEACQNRWECGVDAFQTMLDLLEPLLRCINDTSAGDPDTVEPIARLKPVLKDFNFIITLVVLKNTLCCVSILNPSLKGTISISSTLQYTISNALKLLSKQLQELAIFHRKWFSDAISRAKKLGVEVSLPECDGQSKEQMVLSSPEDYYREMLSAQVLQYLTEQVKKVFSTEMVRILRWLSLVPSYMADHNFSIRKDKVADANLNNLARPDSFYDELGCWEVKWRHASKRRILPTTVFGTLKIPDIGFYPNVQSLLKVLGTIPCVNAEADVYGQYDMVLDRYHSYLHATPEDQRLSNMAFVYVNQDVHFSIEEMVECFVKKHPEILQLLHMEDDVLETQVTEDGGRDASKEEPEEAPVMTFSVEPEKMDSSECREADKETLKDALRTAVTAACCGQSKHSGNASEQGGEVEYVSKSEMKEVLCVCENSVREGILSEVGNSFFSLFIDRVVKLGNREYLPLFLRFVDSFDVMRLELMGFLEADLDCDSMVERLFDIVTKEWHLDFKCCRGQAYLGSGDVSYKLKAFACKIQEKYPLAICTHSSCYSFNTWWSKSIPVPSITRALETMEEVILFFSSDTVLEKQLDQVLALGLRESYEKIQELQGKFCSIWLEMHDSYEVFVQILEPLVDCLEKIKNNKPQRWKANHSEQAARLLWLIKDFDFIVPMVALKNASSFTKELSSGLQKDHFSAASQLCQISGIVATLNRVKTNIKVFHQNWFDEACAVAQSLAVQIKVPDSICTPRDGLQKPAAFYKDALSVPLVDNLISAVKDHFSDHHKEALNFLSLVPCSVTVSYMFENLKSKPPLYSSDLPDPDNFFTELCCWRVKWKTKVVSVAIPSTIFQTLRLPVMQYFGNINTLLRIMCVLPSTALENCGDSMPHKIFQDYLKETPSKDRSPFLAMLHVGTNFSRDLDRMVTQCMKITPKALEGLCLDKESKSLKNTETNMEVDKDGIEDSEILQPTEQKVDHPSKLVGENGHSGDYRQTLEIVFKQAIQLGRRKCLFSELPKEEQQLVQQELSMCHWGGRDGEHISNTNTDEILSILIDSVRKVVLSEVRASPFFSLITDKVAAIAGKKYLPIFVRYVADCVPKVELLGFLPFDEKCDHDVQAKFFEAILTEDWGLQMNYCRGQAYMRFDAGSASLKKLSFNILERYPMAVNTPSESCGLAYWLVGGLPCTAVTKVLDIVEDLLMFFDQCPKLEAELAQAVDELLNTPRDALAEGPETCCSRWKKREDFFDILVDTLDGVLRCLDSDMVSENLPSMYQIDLPESDVLEQDITNWAGVWKEKFQDVSPPASVSETLLHPESKSHPNVSTLLKVVAVLPSVSMECDLMKTTLNSMRAFLRTGTSKHSKTDIAMLHMYHATIQPLEDIVSRCIDVHPEGQALIHQLQKKIRSLQLESEFSTVESNPEETIELQLALNNTAKLYAVGEQHAVDDRLGQKQTVSFYCPSVREEILKELWDSQFFAVITQQVVEVDAVSYIPVCVRYLDKQDVQCEETLALIPFSSDPVAFASTMEMALSEKWGLNMEFCRGQAVLSTGNVGSKMRAASAVVSKKYPMAVRTASSAVSLNVWLARSLPDVSMARCVVTVEEMLKWLSEGALQAKLEDMITWTFRQDEGKANELRDKLGSDWCRSHNVFEVVVELLEVVMHVLYEVMRSTENDCQWGQAQLLSSVIRDFEFIFTITVLKNILGITKNLSQSLQGKPLDMVTAVNCLPAVLASLNEVKLGMSVHHEAWFRESMDLAAKLHVKLLHPGLQNALRDHYRNSVSLKAVEHSIAEVTELFSDHTLSVFRCLTIVPYVMSRMEDSCPENEIISVFKEDLPDASSLSSEVTTWRRKWTDSMGGYLPATVLDTLKLFDIRCFGNIETLLRVLVVLPFARKESTFRQARRSLQEFLQQKTRSLSELYPL